MQQHKKSTSVMESATIKKNEASSKSHTSRRHFFSYFIIATFSVSVALTSCGGGIGGSSYKIKMTTEQDNISFSLSGSGVATVDWGDGSEKDKLTLPTGFSHKYQNPSLRTITINGDIVMELSCRDITSLDISRCIELTQIQCSGKFTSLDVSKNTALTALSIYAQITSLDVSKNIALTELIVPGNQLTSLDVSKNTSLTYLVCHSNQLTSLDVNNNTLLKELNMVSNQLTSTALNALFRTLHSNSDAKKIYIAGNTGQENCERSIAERKGWTFSY